MWPERVVKKKNNRLRRIRRVRNSNNARFYSTRTGIQIRKPNTCWQVPRAYRVTCTLVENEVQRGCRVSIPVET